jgi:hypothetical protein
VGIVTFSFEKWYDEKGAHQNGMHEHRNGAPMQRHFRASSACSETGLEEMSNNLPEADFWPASLKVYSGA